MKYIAVLLLLFLIPIMHATCSENQININSASLNDLDKLIGIGEVKAQAIIDTRPFDSVDDLIEVYGIGEITLEKIKEQGLACVEKTSASNEEDSDEAGTKEELASEEEILTKEDSENEKEESSSNEDKKDYDDLVSKEFVEETQIEVIKLNAKDIKTSNLEENKEPEKNYAIYGLLSFCVLLGALFGIKKLKLKDYKNEFD